MRGDNAAISPQPTWRAHLATHCGAGGCGCPASGAAGCGCPAFGAVRKDELGPRGLFCTKRGLGFIFTPGGRCDRMLPDTATSGVVDGNLSSSTASITAAFSRGSAICASACSRPGMAAVSSNCTIAFRAAWRTSLSFASLKAARNTALPPGVGEPSACMSVIFCTRVCVSSTGACTARLVEPGSGGLLCVSSCTAASSGGGGATTACCRAPFRIAMAATRPITTNSAKMTTFGRIDCSDFWV